MSKRSRVPTIDVPWRKVCAALPALALVGGGITLNALAGPDIKGVGSPAIVVPDGKTNCRGSELSVSDQPTRPIAAGVGLWSSSQSPAVPA